MPGENMQSNRTQFGRLTAALLACLGIAGCGTANSRSDGPPGDTVQVVCTTGQIGDMLQRIGGPHVQVESLMGPGVDPHLYKAVPGDVRKLNAADAVFYNGLHLEGRLADLLEKLAKRRKRAYGSEQVYAVTEGIRQLHKKKRGTGDELLREVSPGHYDPHVWFDVSLWSRCVDYAAEKLIVLDPDHAEDYRRNADDYMARLAELHESCKKELSRIPKDQRMMVTAHDAFGYFGDAYDVEVRGLQGISTADEADLASANALVEILVAGKIKAVFVESSVPRKNVLALIEACAARGHKLAEGGELFSDAMGPAGTPEGTYVGMVEHNLNTIVNALK